jgi:hypothetical protein
MDSAFGIVGLGRRPNTYELAFPMVENLGLGYCAPCNSPPPPPPPTSMPTFTPTCAPCSNTTGGLQATAQTANDAIRLEAGEANKNYGVGQSPATAPAGIAVLSSTPHCSRWLLAYQHGAPRANLLILGHGFSWTQLLAYLSQTFGSKTTFFTFTNNKHTYLFAYEVVGGQILVKLCADGLRARPHSSGRFTMMPPTRRVRGLFRQRQRGLGNVIASQWPGYPSNYNGTNLYVKVLNFPVSSSSWVRVSGIPPVTPEPGGATRLQSDLQELTSSSYQNYDGTPGLNLAALNSAGSPNFNGFIYFAVSDPETGAAQTPGEPDGTVILRASRDQASPNTINIAMATSTASQTSTTALPTAGSAGISAGACPPIRSGNVPIYTPPTPPIQQEPDGTYGPAAQGGLPVGSNPPCPGLWWWQLAWIYMQSAGLPDPNQGGVTPPNQTTSGQWMQTSPGHFVWFPNPVGGLSTIVGGDGVTYTVITSTSGGAAPTSPPFAGAVGQWVPAHPGYAIWIGSSSAATATNYTWLWVLLGVVVVGGGAYYALS